MAQVENPRKGFNFRISFPNPRYPINHFYVQQVTLPDSEIEPVAHGDVNHDIKTAGRRTVGNLICKKLLSSTPGSGDDKNLWIWHDACQRFGTGSIAPAGSAGYKLIVVLDELGGDGVSILNTWVFRGAWPCKILGQEHDRLSSDNTIESVEFSVDIVEKG